MSERSQEFTDEFCSHCGTSPCSHPDMGAALALAERDIAARWLSYSLVTNLLALLGLLVTLVVC